MKKYILFLLTLPFLGYAQNNSQEIELSIGWSIFSTYITPSNNTLDSIFAPIIDDVIIIKNETSSFVYFPHWNNK